MAKPTILLVPTDPASPLLAEGPAGGWRYPCPYCRNPGPWDCGCRADCRVVVLDGGEVRDAR